MTTSESWLPYVLHFCITNSLLRNFWLARRFITTTQNISQDYFDREYSLNTLLATELGDKFLMCQAIRGEANGGTGQLVFQGLSADARFPDLGMEEKNLEEINHFSMYFMSDSELHEALNRIDFWHPAGSFCITVVNPKGCSQMEAGHNWTSSEGGSP